MNVPFQIKQVRHVFFYAMLLLIVAFGNAHAQTGGDVSYIGVKIVPDPSSRCFGDNFTPDSIYVYEKAGFPGAFGYTGGADSNAIAIPAPKGFAFWSPVEASVLPNKATKSDIEPSSVVATNTLFDITCTFKTKNTQKIDTIVLKKISLIAFLNDPEGDYEDEIKVNVDIYGDKDTVFKRPGYTMKVPEISLSLDSLYPAPPYCELDERIHFRVKVSGNDGCTSGYGEISLVGHKPDGSYKTLETYSSWNDDSTFSTRNLDANYDKVYLNLSRNYYAHVFSNPLSVGYTDDGTVNDIEFLKVNSTMHFETKSKTMGSNSGNLLLYSMLDTTFTESDVPMVSIRAGLFVDDTNSTYLVFPDGTPYANNETIYRFEFQGDGGAYQDILDQKGMEYLAGDCDSPFGNIHFPIFGPIMRYCRYLAQSAFMNTRNFNPAESWVDYPDSTAVYYRELHGFPQYNKYCSILDTAYITVIPKPINVLPEYCASDKSNYKIRVSRKIPKGYPSNTKYKDFIIVVGSDTTKYLPGEEDSEDAFAYYFKFAPKAWFDSNTSLTTDKLIVNFYTRGTYFDTLSEARTIRIDENSSTIYATNYDDFEVFGIDSVLCNNPLDSFRITSKYTLDSLKGYSVYESFSGAAVDWYFKPDLSYQHYNKWPESLRDTIFVFFKDYNGCVGKDPIGFKVNPIPRLGFGVSDLCIDRNVLFNSETGDTLTEAGTGDTLNIYTWNFGDGTTYESGPYPLDDIPQGFDKWVTSGTKQIPRHRYASPDEYEVKLKVGTTRGCEAEISKNIRVEGVPEPDFEFAHTGLEQNTVEFTNLSVPSDFETDYTYSWDFDDSHTAQTADTATPVDNTYGQHGIYNVLLRATTTNGCAANITKKVPVFPYVEVTDKSLASYTFSEGDGWYASRDFDHGLPSGWHLAEVTDNWMDEKHHAGEMWLTGTPEDTLDNETGWIESPCFDFRSLGFPMISLDIYESLEPGRDGAVLQYTLNDGVTWKRLGNMGIGANWYDRDGVYSSPGTKDGGLNVGSLGWSKDTAAWVTARYPLDNIKQESQDAGACVRFRIAYSSNDYHDAAYAGFAVDNFFIGKRKRIVLLEQFINSAFEDANAGPAKADLARLDDFVDSHKKEVVDIRYHMANSYIEDPLYRTLNNWWDNSARAWEYGADPYGPMWVMDGTAVRSVIWNVPQGISFADGLEKRALIDPSFDIDTVWTKLDGGSLQISASIKKVNGQLDEKLGPHDHKVRFAIVQKYFTDDQGKTHRNVLVDLLPNGVGNVVKTLYAPYPVGSTDTVTATWVPAVKTTGNDYRLVIYIQGRYNYDEVEQVWFRDLKTSEVPQTTTGVHIPIASGNGFTIYPNPVTDNMQVIMPDGFGNGTSWRIFSMSGQVVSSGMFYGSGTRETISARDLEKGFYVLRLTNKEGVQISSKFSKER